MSYKCYWYIMSVICLMLYKYCYIMLVALTWLAYSPCRPWLGWRPGGPGAESPRWSDASPGRWWRNTGWKVGIPPSPGSCRLGKSPTPRSCISCPQSQQVSSSTTRPLAELSDPLHQKTSGRRGTSDLFGVACRYDWAHHLVVDFDWSSPLDWYYL